MTRLRERTGRVFYVLKREERRGSFLAARDNVDPRNDPSVDDPKKKGGIPWCAWKR